MTPHLNRLCETVQMRGSQHMVSIRNMKKTCHRDRIASLTAPCPSHKKLNIKLFANAHAAADANADAGHSTIALPGLCASELKIIPQLSSNTPSYLELWYCLPSHLHVFKALLHFLLPYRQRLCLSSRVFFFSLSLSSIHFPDANKGKTIFGISYHLWMTPKNVFPCY